MTMRCKSELEGRRPSVDLSGPDGNAFALMGYAKRWCRDLGLDSEKVLAEMMDGDYENLLEVLDGYFGDYVDFYR